jgi:Flp pilus assembly protein TadD
MARTTTAAGAGPFRERFNDVLDTVTGTRYSIGPDYRIIFDRPATGAKGVRDLKWAIGSGAVGRSYAFLLDGFLFQAPLSYFSAAGKWDLSPGYTGKTYVDVARPIEEACLQCHATGVRLVPDTQNRYLDPPFLEPGVGCERCHGPGRSHIEAMHAGAADRAIVNPAKLAGERRDSVCLQCHLTGAARVTRAGVVPFSYRPGDRLSDSLTVFVWSGAGEGELAAATDHGEQLARSRCRIAAGPRLWCGTCHDPHPTASRNNAVQTACLSCHDSSACTEMKAARSAVHDDCASCHMPKRRSREGQHIAFTLHSIPRRLPAPSTERGRKRGLRPFFSGEVADRDIALAYATLAAEDRSYRDEAIRLLRRVREPDAIVLVQLAQLYDARGPSEEAERLYSSALRTDPKNPAAQANLGIYLMRRGEADKAMQLWEDVASRYPALVGPAMNLASAQVQAGRLQDAEITIRRLLRYHPDHTPARSLLAQLVRQRSSGTASGPP